ncbi:MAG: DUF5615 family PIN-like protein [Cyclobacteriaceae bacterium]
MSKGVSFLVDAQLPAKLCEILNGLGVNSIHVDSLPNGDESTDDEIVAYADKHDIIVITKDIDFHIKQSLNKGPRRLLYVKTGNIKNRQLFDLFRSHISRITDLFEQSTYIQLTTNGPLSAVK